MMKPKILKGEDTMEQRKGKTRYLVETEDGFLVSVPEDKMESWQKADHDAPLTPAEQRLKDRILEELYGSKK